MEARRSARPVVQVIDESNPKLGGFFRLVVSERRNLVRTLVQALIAAGVRVRNTGRPGGRVAWYMWAVDELPGPVATIIVRVRVADGDPIEGAVSLKLDNGTTLSAAVTLERWHTSALARRRQLSELVDHALNDVRLPPERGIGLDLLDPEDSVWELNEWLSLQIQDVRPGCPVFGADVARLLLAAGWVDRGPAECPTWARWDGMVTAVSADDRLWTAPGATVEAGARGSLLVHSPRDVSGARRTVFFYDDGEGWYCDGGSYGPLSNYRENLRAEVAK